MANFRNHDTVYWNSPQGITYGEIIQKVVRTGNFHGLNITASRNDPSYVVKSARSGELAAYRPDGLEKA